MSVNPANDKILGSNIGAASPAAASTLVDTGEEKKTSANVYDSTTSSFSSETQTTYDFNGTGYDTYEDVKSAVYEYYGLSENFEYSSSDDNEDAFNFIPGYSDESVTEYDGKLRKLNQDRPEILGQIEFRPLISENSDGMPRTKRINTIQESVKRVIENYGLDNENLLFSKGGQMFAIQSHIRIALQAIIRDLFSNMVDYDMTDIMKKIAFSTENKNCLKDVDYQPPFPATVSNRDVIDKIREKDPVLADELEPYVGDKYLNLIFVYFLNSKFSDKIFFWRSSTNPAPLDLTVEKTNVTTYDVNNSGKFIDYLLISKSVASIIEQIKLAAGINSNSVKDRLISVLELDSTTIPDIIKLHRILNSALASCFGVSILSPGYGDASVGNGVIGSTVAASVASTAFGTSNTAAGHVLSSGVGVNNSGNSNTSSPSSTVSGIAVSSTVTGQVPGTSAGVGPGGSASTSLDSLVQGLSVHINKNQLHNATKKFFLMQNTSNKHFSLMLSNIISKVHPCTRGKKGTWKNNGKYKGHVLHQNNDFTTTSAKSAVRKMYTECIPNINDSSNIHPLSQIMSMLVSDLKYCTANNPENIALLKTQLKSSTDDRGPIRGYFSRLAKKFSHCPIRYGSDPTESSILEDNSDAVNGNLDKSGKFSEYLIGEGQTNNINYQYNKAELFDSVGAASDSKVRGVDIGTSALGKIYYVKNTQALSWDSGVNIGAPDPTSSANVHSAKRHSVAAYTFDGLPPENPRPAGGLTGNNVAGDPNPIVEPNVIDDFYQYEPEEKYIDNFSTKIKKEVDDLVKDFNNTFDLNRDLEDDFTYKYLDKLFDKIGEQFEYVATGNVEVVPGYSQSVMYDDLYFEHLESLHLLQFARNYDNTGDYKAMLFFCSLLTHYYKKHVYFESGFGAAQMQQDIPQHYGHLSEENNGFPEGPSDMNNKISGRTLSTELYNVLYNNISNSLEWNNGNQNNETVYNPTIRFYGLSSAQTSQGFISQNVTFKGAIDDGGVMEADLSDFVEDTKSERIVLLSDMLAREYYNELPGFKGQGGKAYAFGYSKDRNYKHYDEYDDITIDADKFFENTDYMQSETSYTRKFSEQIRTFSDTPERFSISDKSSSSWNGNSGMTNQRFLDIINYKEFRKEMLLDNQGDTDFEAIFPPYEELITGNFSSGNTEFKEKMLTTSVMKSLGIQVESNGSVAQDNLTSCQELRSVAKFYGFIQKLLKYDSGAWEPPPFFDIILNFDDEFMRQYYPERFSNMDNIFTGVGLDNQNLGSLGSNSIQRSAVIYEIISYLAHEVHSTCISIPETYNKNTLNKNTTLQSNQIYIYKNASICSGIADGLKGKTNRYIYHGIGASGYDLELFNLGTDEELVSSGGATSSTLLKNRQRFINYNFGYYRSKEIRESFMSAVSTNIKSSTELLKLVSKSGGILDTVNKGKADVVVSNPVKIPVPGTPDVFDNLIGLQSEVQYLGYPIMKRKLMRQSIDSFYLPCSKSVSISQIKAAINFFSLPANGYMSTYTASAKDTQRGGKLIFHIGIPVELVNKKIINQPISIKVLRSNHRKQIVEIYKKKFCFLPTLHYFNNCQVPTGIVNRDIIENLNDSMSEDLFYNSHILKYTFSSDKNAIASDRHAMRDVRYYNIAGESGSESSLEHISNLMLKSIFKNHVADYYLKLYTKIMSGLDFDEDVFQITDDDKITISPGADASPFKGAADLNAYFLNKINQEINQGSYDNETKISLQKELNRIGFESGRSVFFSPFKYLYRTIRTRAFDRVFSLFVEESDENFVPATSLGDLVTSYTVPIGSGIGSDSVVNSYFIEIDLADGNTYGMPLPGENNSTAIVL